MADGAAAVERFGAADEYPVEVTRKGKTRTVDLKGVAITIADHADGGWQVCAPAAGTGARIRDVLGAVFGDDCAAGIRGWSTMRVDTLFEGAAAADRGGAQPSV